MSSNFIITAPILDFKKNRKDEIQFLIDDASYNDISFTVMAGPLSGHKFSGNDFFDVLCILRKHLESIGYLIAIKGALLTVYPTGVSLDYTRNKIAYKLHEDDRLATTVRVFDVILSSEFSDVATVDEQRSYREKIVKRDLKNISLQNNKP